MSMLCFSILSVTQSAASSAVLYWHLARSIKGKHGNRGMNSVGCDPLVDRWVACTGRCAVAQVLPLTHCGDNVAAPGPSHGPPIPCLAAPGNS
jgi:hypothetical protein